MASVFAPFDEVPVEDFRRVTDVTYHGAVWGTRAALKRMLATDRGTVIPLQSAYCAAKSALRGFTDALRSELVHRKSRVHVTLLVLGAFNTPQFDWAKTTLGRRLRPVGKVYQPEVAARAIVDAALGNIFVPGLLDRWLSRKAWEGQYTDEPLEPGRLDNLHAPVPEDRGAHGRFEHEARAASLQYEAAHRPLLSALLLAAAGLATFGALRRLRR